MENQSISSEELDSPPHKKQRRNDETLDSFEETSCAGCDTEIMVGKNDCRCYYCQLYFCNSCGTFLGSFPDIDDFVCHACKKEISSNLIACYQCEDTYHKDDWELTVCYKCQKIALCDNCTTKKKRTDKPILYYCNECDEPICFKCLNDTKYTILKIEKNRFEVRYIISVCNSCAKKQ